MARGSMIIRDLHVTGTGLVIRPFETNAILIVDADGVLSRSIANHLFESVSRDRAQVSK